MERLSMQCEFESLRDTEPSPSSFLPEGIEKIFKATPRDWARKNARARSGGLVKEVQSIPQMALRLGKKMLVLNYA